MAVKKVKKSAKTTKKMPAGKKTAASSFSKKSGSVAKAFTKSEILSNISELTGLAKKEVGDVILALNHVIERHIKKGGPGVFVLPGMVKFQVIHKAATKARKGVNPFTGEDTVFKAKPARYIVKVKALKALKEMV